MFWVFFSMRLIWIRLVVKDLFYNEQMAAASNTTLVLWTISVLFRLCSWVNSNWLYAGNAEIFSLHTMYITFIPNISRIFFEYLKLKSSTRRLTNEAQEVHRNLIPLYHQFTTLLKQDGFFANFKIYNYKHWVCTSFSRGKNLTTENVCEVPIFLCTIFYQSIKVVGNS